MKLLLLSRDFPQQKSAISTWSFEMAKRLARRCEDFAVLSLGAGIPAGGEPPFDVLRLPVPANAPARDGHARRVGLSRARRRFDIVLGADWVSAAVALAWRQRSSARRVFAAAHGPELEWQPLHAGWPLGGIYRRARDLALSRVDAVFATSRHAGALIDEREGRRRVALVGSGCDVERFRPDAAGALGRELGLSGRRVLLSVAQLVPERRIDKVLFAVSALGVRYPELRYVIAGDGPERERLTLLAERLRIAHRIRFLGAVDESRLPHVYNLCDVFVHLLADGALGDPSEAALREALACARPAVVTPGAGADLSDEQTGFVVPDGDSSALGEALSTLLDQPELAAHLGERGRARVRARATWEHAADRLLDAMAAADEAAPPVSRGAGRGPHAARRAPGVESMASRARLGVMLSGR
jgi:phosphatidylinositol alpha-1,6-mannosyltransferase